MQHNQIHQQRAAVYQWFSQLLFRELDEKQLASLENGNSQAWIASLEALMARMVAKEEKFSVQYYFLHHHILCWAPLFRDACLVRDNEGFYPQAVNLIVRFMQEDEQYLESLLMDDFYFSSQR